MHNTIDKNWFKETEIVIKDPLLFKSKLAIGEDAYASLRLKNKVAETWEASVAATVAAGIAKSSAVASTFFVPNGFLGLIGIGTATTPIGWVVAASVLAGGAWLGIIRYLKTTTENMVIVIPKFINTPMDVLAIGLFELIAPLALKVAEVDGKIDENEKNHISNFFAKEWGYDESFINEGMAFAEAKLPELSIEELAETLAKFKKANPDCNYKSMSLQILDFLKDVVEADGLLHERERIAMKKIKNIFLETNQSIILKGTRSGIKRIKNSSKIFGNYVSQKFNDKKSTY